mgnify:CR=1 FL=1|jgi:predicted nucleic acid-binding Zn ribbon protein
MPIYAYQCPSCGKSADVLVRGGREPSTTDDVPELFNCCDQSGPIVKKLSAPYVARGGVTSVSSRSAPDPGTCGSCGMAPGSCGMDN